MKLNTVGPLLNGKELADAGGGVCDVRNPATGAVIAHQACCSPETVARIVENSQATFASRGMP